MSGPIQTEPALHYLVDAVSDYAIYMLDPEGCVASWNTGARRLKGYDAAEIRGRSFSEFFTPEDRAAGVPQDILQRAARDGRVEVEGWRLRKDGSRFWALGTLHAIRDPDGTLVGYAKVTRDMTERKAAQEALAASERQFRLLVSGVVDYAIFMLDPHGVVTNWNTGAQNIKGYAVDEIVGRHFSVFYTDEERAAGAPDRALATAAAQGRYEA